MKLSWKFAGKEMIQPIITDYDGNVYTEVVVGTQTWLSRPLRTTHFLDGTTIPELISDSEWSNNGTNTGYCKVNNSDTNLLQYGLLYTWGSVFSGNTLKFVDGYRLPTQAEDVIFTDYVKNNGIYSDIMSDELWTTGNGSNIYNTNFAPSGYRDDAGVFTHVGSESYWRVSDYISLTEAYWQLVFNTSPYFYLDYKNSWSAGMAIRLIKE
jgi:uncharacterized protein (TIGR02145 family)